MAELLHVHLLGTFRIAYGGQPLSGFNTRLQALLAYLLLHPAAPLLRQQLAFLFWPDSTEAQARTNLRQLLHSLKQALPDTDLFLEADAQALLWRGDAPVRLDVADFEGALARTAAAGRQADAPSVRVALELAVALYDGDLLPACYDDWLLPERERLRQAFAGALERLVHLLESQDDPRGALACAERLLRHDPLREETYRTLMRLHAAVGDRAGVVRTYHTCQSVLQRELAVEPSSATREAYEQALKADMAERPGKSHPPPAHTNLPVPLTSFVGRERELTEVKHLLGTTRLLTLTGPGGTGKTRLALKLAAGVRENFAAGAWLVELAPLADPALVTQTIAATLGVREQPGRTILDALLDFVRVKSLLLILDNCEHLIEACAQLADSLLRAAPGLTILASSREALGIAGETTYRVPSLPLPDPRQAHDPDSLAHNDCVRLFIDRAVATYPSFRLKAKYAPAIADICRRLDGIPLAIELAAARTKVFPPEQILARLDDRFRLLTGGSRAALPRHQTLRALIDWSYDLLPEAERALLRRLSVFARSWSFEGAQVVCGDDLGADVLDLLPHLVDKSLVAFEEAEEEGRYSLLETIRQYARDKLLESDEAASVRDHHLEYFLRLAEEAERKLRGPEQLAWLGRLETEHDNLRTALSWSLESGQIESTLRLAAALFYMWELSGYWTEGQKWLDEALALARRDPGGRSAEGERSAPDRAAAARRAKALYAAARLHYLLLDFEGWGTLGQESLSLWRELGDKWWIAVALELMGVLSLFRGDPQAAGAQFEEGVSLAREVDDRWPLVMCLMRLSNVFTRTDSVAAQPIMEEGVALARRVGDQTLLGGVLLTLASTNLSEGNLTEAAHAAEEALAAAGARRGNLFVLLALLISVVIACSQGDRARAEEYCLQVLAIVREGGNPIAALFALFSFGALAGISGQPEQCVRLVSAAEAWAHQRGLNINILGGAVAMLFNRVMESPRAQLAPAAFEAAWAEGQQMTVEQALALATAGETPTPQPQTDGPRPTSG